MPLFERPDKVESPLYVLTSIYNPVRFRNRWKLYENFAKMVKQTEAILYTVEVAYGERKFVLPFPEPPHFLLQLRTDHEVWCKENALDLLSHRLPLDAKYLAWADADIIFVRPDWVGETLHQLQHYDIVQMFSQAIDLDSQYHHLARFLGFVYCWKHQYPVAQPPPPYGCPPWHEPFTWHPGLAWAYKRKAWNNIGGLIDWMVLGGADYFAAAAYCEQERWYPEYLGEDGVGLLKQYRNRCDQYINGNVGCLDGRILHNWHGHKDHRSYEDRGSILTAGIFHPQEDLKRDSQGLWQLEPHAKALRDGIRYYMRKRKEDNLE